MRRYLVAVCCVVMAACAAQPAISGGDVAQVEAALTNAQNAAHQAGCGPVASEIDADAALARGALAAGQSPVGYMNDLNTKLIACNQAVLARRGVGAPQTAANPEPDPLEAVAALRRKWARDEAARAAVERREREEAAAREAREKKRFEGAVAACLAKPSPAIGMTADQVLASRWGRPWSVNETETAGEVSQQLVYPWADNDECGHVDDSRHRYLYLSNGVLVAIQR